MLARSRASCGHAEAGVVGLPGIIIHRRRVGLRAVADALVGEALLDVGAFAVELRIEAAIQRFLDAPAIGAVVVGRAVILRDVADTVKGALNLTAPVE